MKTFLKKENLKSTIYSLVYLVFGLLFCIMPAKMFNFVESALCFVLLIAGIICVLIYSLMSIEDKEFKMLLYGIVGLVLGICMFLFQRLFGIILSIVIGLGGVSMIVSGIKGKKTKNPQWIADFVIGLIVTTLAITTIVLSGTEVAEKIIAIFFGIMCLINGIYSLVGLILLIKKEGKQTSSEDSEETKSETQEKVETEKVEESEDLKTEETKLEEPKETKKEKAEKK